MTYGEEATFCWMNKTDPRPPTRLVDDPTHTHTQHTIQSHMIIKMLDMKALLLAVVVLLMAMLCPNLSVLAFTPPARPIAVVHSSSLSILRKQPQQGQLQQPLAAAKNDKSETKDASLSTTATSSSVMAFLTAQVLPVAAAMAAADASDYEVVDLPPPYVPALFGVALLGGVGLLTGSLGNVMDEEASLGMQSGARAKKEIERSRSSYFKKK